MDGLVVEKIESFYARYPRRHFKKGHILIYAGDTSPGVYQLLEGEVRQYDITSGGDEVVVGIFQPPAIFPMITIARQYSDGYFYEAVTDIDVRLAPIKDIRTLLETNPDIVFGLLNEMYLAAGELTQEIKILKRGSARDKLLLTLVSMCKRSSKNTAGMCRVNVTEKEIASRAGLSRETTSRELRKLHRSDCIVMGYRTIFIKDLAILEKELYGET